MCSFCAGASRVSLYGSSNENPEQRNNSRRLAALAMQTGQEERGEGPAARYLVSHSHHGPGQVPGPQQPPVGTTVLGTKPSRAGAQEPIPEGKGMGAVLRGSQLDTPWCLQKEDKYALQDQNEGKASFRKRKKTREAA